jgi:hypothetical protein
MSDFMVGTPAEWKDFARRHARFLQRHSYLTDTIKAAFETDLGHDVSLASRVVYLLGRGCVDDFEEIVILAGNGRGFGALKLLRGMFERYVTASHIHANPHDALKFVDYFWVQQHRLLEQMISIFGPQLFDAPELQAGLEETRQHYAKVKDKFTIPCCPRCKDKRVNHTWHRMDVVSMAGKLGGGAKALTISGYYMPMKQIHATLGAILSRVEDTEQTLSYTGAVNRDRSDEALQTAHLLLLGAIALQIDHFKLQAVGPGFEQCSRDFADIWRDSTAA